MKESDWKKFKIIKKQALDNYCKDAIEKSGNIISDNSNDYHERYLALYDHIQDSDKTLASTFDGHSRSGAWLQLLQMLKLNLVTDKAFSELSTELQNQCKPHNREK